jgi:enamine deaminase RidA (YjgF/YER057c/UK114 family)
MNHQVQSETLAPPAANYAHAVVSSAGSTMLHTSGVVPISPDGSVPEGLAAQAAQVWANLAVIVNTAGFAMTDVVSVTTYVVTGQELTLVMAARDSALDGHRASSALIPVPALARPEWLVEIALVAAR